MQVVENSDFYNMQAADLSYLYQQFINSYQQVKADGRSVLLLVILQVYY